MAKRIANPKKLLKAAGVVPVFYPPGGSEPHFLMMRRRGLHDGTAGMEVLAFGGRKKRIDANLRETAVRELSEESSLKLSPENLIGKVRAHFAPGIRGTIKIHYYENPDEVLREEERINRGEHEEFDAARAISLSGFKKELGWNVHQSLVRQGRKIVAIVEEWLQTRPPDRKRA